MGPKTAKRSIQQVYSSEKTVEEGAAPVVEKTKMTWSARETEILVNEFISRRDIMNGAYSGTVTKQEKHKAWDEISNSLLIECPTSAKTTAQIKKKWENMVKDTKVEVSKYNASMKGTGGGSSYVWKNLVFKKIYEQAIGRDNPSVPGGQILGGVESETSERLLEDSTSALCNDILSSGKGVLKDRLELLDVMLRVRRNLGNPIEESEIPDDLLKALNNIKDFC